MVVAVLLLTAGIIVAGSFLPTQVASTVVDAAPLVGRTSTVCPAAVHNSDADAPAGDQPAATITAVVIRQAPDRDGRLTATPLGGGDQLFEVTQQGFGAQAKAPTGRAVAGSRSDGDREQRSNLGVGGLR